MGTVYYGHLSPLRIVILRVGHWTHICSDSPGTKVLDHAWVLLTAVRSLWHRYHWDLHTDAERWQPHMVTSYYRVVYMWERCNRAWLPASHLAGPTLPSWESLRSSSSMLRCLAACTAEGYAGMQLQDSSCLAGEGTPCSFPQTCWAPRHISLASGNRKYWVVDRSVFVNFVKHVWALCLHICLSFTSVKCPQRSEEVWWIPWDWNCR